MYYGGVGWEIARGGVEEKSGIVGTVDGDIGAEGEDLGNGGWWLRW